MMHRRVVEDGKKKTDGCCEHGHGSHHHTHHAVVKTPPRKRRKAKSNMVSVRNVLQTVMDEDLLISLVQVVSILIMIGCGATLAAKWISFGDWVESWKSLSGFDNIPHQPGQTFPKKPLAPSKYYTVPESMEHIGDKSDSYALLRKEYDAKMKLLSADQLFSKEYYHQFQFSPMAMEEPAADNNSAAGKEPDAEVLQLEQVLDQVPYDIYNCPDVPPEGYPFAWTLLDVLEHWGPDDPEPNPDRKLFQGLCVFDYQTDYEKAVTYREAEKPFVVTNDPQVHNAVYRWNQPKYLERMLGPAVKHRAEYSENNHFLYWNKPPQHNKGAGRLGRGGAPKPWQNKVETPKDWIEPTQMMRMTYGEWLEHANVTDDSLLGPDMPHWYFRLIGCGETGPEGQCDAGSSEYLFDELTFFQPKESLYMVKPEAQKGIHCRFGMKGVIAENHFDGSRNAIAVLGGARRYILAHPSQCNYLSLLPKGHPSARHSAVDWSDPDLDSFPEFALAKGNEVVLQAGDVLYLPTNWFHFIVSLTLNFQCNTRSGITQDYNLPIHECGF
mmetsp:Transcript_25825/g.39626  ORF Transcript_25825/g.39626 Transcript_25825/m.39626 type:complete len:553 (+) Transcript_25825:130-1788(+)